MARPYAPLAFANEFILKAAGIGGAEHMKLQKLVYCAYGWWLAYHDEPILSEAPQVWTHGPVFKSMYHALKHFGRDEIFTIQKSNPFADAPRVDPSDHEVCQLLDWIWQRYGSKSAYYLSDLTHQKGSPWYKVAESCGFRVPHDKEIPEELIKEHFRMLAIEYGSRDAVAAG